jgi:hypothetical protein
MVGFLSACRCLADAQCVLCVCLDAPPGRVEKAGSDMISHIPGRLRLPGRLEATRYKDRRTPRSLCRHDVTIGLVPNDDDSASCEPADDTVKLTLLLGQFPNALERGKQPVQFKHALLLLDAAFRHSIELQSCVLGYTDTLSPSAHFPGSPVIGPTLLRRFRAGARRASPVAWLVLVTVPSLPPRRSGSAASFRFRPPMLPSPSSCGLGLRGHSLSGPHPRSLSLRPGDSHLPCGRSVDRLQSIGLPPLC